MIVSFILAAALASGTVVPTFAGSWAPFYGFIGTWSGTRTTPEGTVSVTRQYESVVRNQHLLVTERVASDFAPWGMISFDGEHEAFVLRRFRPDGSVTELTLKDVSKSPGTLVFANAPANGTPAERITHEQQGSNEFVERLEVVTDGGSPTVVSETHFRRKR